MRLNQFLSKAGAALSRRKADELITAGRVRVNGNLPVLGMDIDPEKDSVTMGTKRFTITPERIVIALNKPVGYDTTRSDPHAKRIVYQLLPESVRNTVHAIGRLDRDTSGLLLFTNDGDLTQRLTHPSYGHEKEYLVTLDGPLPEAARVAFERGIRLDDGPTGPSKIRHVRTDHTAQTTSFLLMISEGRNRQVRRMCEALALPLLRLHRVRMGQVELGSLPEGKWRFENPALFSPEEG